MSEALALAAGLERELRQAEECLLAAPRPGRDRGGVDWGELELRLERGVDGMERLKGLACGGLGEGARREAVNLVEGIGAGLRRVAALLEQAGEIYGGWFGVSGVEAGYTAGEATRREVARGVRVDRLG
ncbi:MAG: hypothetical protein HY858_09140 [Candidatus Solibacter usitatus]|nr:hypothetical protein [Candidatus Solibacter usitatus]